MPDPERPDSNRPESEEELDARLRRLLGESDTPDTDLATEAELRARQLSEHPLEHSETAHSEMDAIEAEFKERMQGLDKRLDEAQTKRKAAEVKQNPASSSIGQGDAQGLGVGLSIAYAILGIPILFGLIGVLLDKMLGKSLSGPLTITGVILAMAYTFFVLSRENKS